MITGPETDSFAKAPTTFHLWAWNRRRRRRIARNVKIMGESCEIMAIFYFVRHGETAWNAEGRICGPTDVPLSDVGRHQAELLARRFASIPVEALYSSPLRRSMHTARIVGQSISREPIVDPRLSELNYGLWEGKTFAEIKRAEPEAYQAWAADPADLAPPGGETGVELIERLAPVLGNLDDRHPEGNVVVVCHKTLCRLLICKITGVPLREYRRQVPMNNVAVNIFECVQGIGES
jgi:probable phosphoglycerate mutase